MQPTLRDVHLHHWLLIESLERCQTSLLSLHLESVALQTPEDTEPWTAVIGCLQRMERLRKSYKSDLSFANAISHLMIKVRGSLPLSVGPNVSGLADDTETKEDDTELFVNVAHKTA